MGYFCQNESGEVRHGGLFLPTFSPRIGPESIATSNGEAVKMAWLAISPSFTKAPTITQTSSTSSKG